MTPEEQKRKRLIVALIAIIVIGIIFIAFTTNPAQKPPPEEEVWGELPTEPTYESPNDPGFVSPYDHNKDIRLTLHPVWLKNLPSEIHALSSSQPDCNFIKFVDAEDILSFTLTPTENLDISKAKIYLISHNLMKDPYTTPISEIPHLLALDFESQDDGTWLAETMLGYGFSDTSLLDVLFVYDDNIEMRTQLTITENNTSSPLYWQAKFPDQTLELFFIKMGDDTVTHCYFPDRHNSLFNWLGEATSQGWHHKDGKVFDETETWYFDYEEYTAPLSPNQTLEAHKFTTPDCIVNTEFDVSNTDYLTSYLTQDDEYVHANFGAPNRIIKIGNVTRIEYTYAIFYVDKTDGVIQIDIQPGFVPAINALPYTECTYVELSNICKKYNIDMPIPTTTEQPDMEYYVTRLSFKVGDYTVCYVWESNQPVNITTARFTRIVIHTGDNYNY